MDTIQIFESIYKDNIWNDPMSRSGNGSTLEQTKRIREVIPVIVEKYKIISFLDIPCGDFFWMKVIQPQLNTILKSYVGGDIVSELISINNENYSNPVFQFIHCDLLTSLLPYADLVLCRDCLVHFSYRDILKAIINIKKSESKYLLTTTFPGRRNKNIPTGAWRPIDLQKFPFYFPVPIELHNEECSELDRQFSDKSLSLWKINSIGTFKLRVIVIVFQFYYLIKAFFKKYAHLHL